MATNNLNTAQYQLEPATAASLREALIAYPNNIVPQETIAACVLTGGLLTIQQYPQLSTDMPLDKLLDLLNNHTTTMH